MLLKIVFLIFKFHEMHDSGANGKQHIWKEYHKNCYCLNNVLHILLIIFKIIRKSGGYRSLSRVL